VPKKKTLVAPSPTTAMEGTEVAVEGIRDVGEGTVAIDLPTPDGWSIKPGQFVQIGAPVGEEFIVRHYTVSSPYNDGGFEITVGVDPDGDLSPVLAELEEGDYVSVDGPYGRSYYEGEDRVVVLAGGPGVGPAVGIAERVADEHGAENTAVVYRDVEHAHLDRLERYATRERTSNFLMTTNSCAEALPTSTGRRSSSTASTGSYRRRRRRSTPPATRERRRSRTLDSR